MRFSSAFHINLTGALLRAVNDILRMIQGAKENIGERLVHGGERAADDVVSEGDRALISIDAVQPEAEKVWQPLWPLGQSHGSSSSGFNRSFRNGLRRRMSGDFDADLSASVYQTRLQIDARSNTTLHHQPSFVLSDDIRVGFSILNLSGQSIRYIQGGDEGKYSIFYLADSERGALNFLASTTLIRNNQIFEEEFTVQQPKLAISDTQSSKATRTVRIGHQVAVQVSGYKWLPCVQADTLGVRYEELHPVIGRKSLSAFFQVSKNSNNAVKHILNATRLVTEVRPFNGGRLLTLKSVFCFQNNTTHAISILGTAARRQQSSQGNSLGMTGSNSPVDSDEQQVFRLESGSLFHVPISLLHNSALADARTPSLGSIYIKPYDLNPVKEELVGKHYMQPGSVSYTVEPIDLLDVVMESQRTNAEDDDDNSGAENSNSILASQYCCNVRPRPRGRRQDSVKSGAAGADAAENNVGMTGRLPPFCYTTEIRRIGSGDVSAYDDTNTGVEGSNKFEIKAFASNIAEKFFSSNNRGPAMLNHPASYMISKLVCEYSSIMFVGYCIILSIVLEYSNSSSNYFGEFIGLWRQIYSGSCYT